MITKAIALASPLLAVAVAAGAPGAEAGGKPLSLFLEPVGEGVAQGVSDDKCVAELKAAFASRKLRVVATPEEADARAEVRECVVYSRSRAKSKVKQTGGEIKGPQPGHKIIPGGAHATGSEGEYGASMEEERFVLIVVRLSVGDRFGDVSSDKQDEHLKQAARSVAKDAEAWLAEVKPRRP